MQSIRITMVLVALLSFMPSSAQADSFRIGEEKTFAFFGAATYTFGGDSELHLQPTFGAGYEWQEQSFWGAKCAPFAIGALFEDDGSAGGLIGGGGLCNVAEWDGLKLRGGAAAGIGFGGGEDWPVWPAATLMAEAQFTDFTIGGGPPALILQAAPADGGAKFGLLVRFDLP